MYLKLRSLVQVFAFASNLSSKSLFSQHLLVLLKWQLIKADTLSVDRDERNSVLIHLTTLNTRSLSALEAGIDKSRSDRVAM